MAQRLKRWESPRRQGRNDKGKGGSARQRQLKKQQQLLRKKLKDSPKDSRNSQNSKEGGDISSSPVFVFASRSSRLGFA
jgi:hypothetical protein